MDRRLLRPAFALSVTALLTVAGTAADAAPTARQKCVAGKRQAVGKLLASLLACDAKATSAGEAVDPACGTTARDKAAAAWTKLEAAPGADCVATGDLPSLEAVADAAQDDLEASQGVPGAASRCTAAKLKAAGKGGACELRCTAKGYLKGQSFLHADVVECRGKCSYKLAARSVTAELDPDGACHTTGDTASIQSVVATFTDDAVALLPPPGALCDLPGSLRFTAMGVATVPGGNPSWPDLGFLSLPQGFCAHYFATVGNPRQVRFAPGGDLFVASPTRATTGGGPGGQNAILVLPDDDDDGVADETIVFESGLNATQGLLFHDGWFYYQDDADIRRRPFAPGDRSPAGPTTVVATINHYYSGLHWPKALDAADDGTIYVANGGDQAEPCMQPPVFSGGILKLDSPYGTPVAAGMRSAISLRCAHGHNRCFAIELAKDYSTPYGGREKMVEIRNGDDWGFPCCATTNVPYSLTPPLPDCSAVDTEEVAFLIGDTPFSVDFAPGTWPAPYSGSALISSHGAYGTWTGAGVVAVEMDELTGLPLPSSKLSGVPTGAMTQFAAGWDDGTHAHGRPADLTFAPDGRLFLANDNNGVILWIAPIE